MARQQQQPAQFSAVQIETSENGFIVRAGRDMRQGVESRLYTFESFASMTKWLSKNLEGGAA